MPPVGDGDEPEFGSVEFIRGWTFEELSGLVRFGRNLALQARTAMELTYDRDPTVKCDLSGRLFNVLPLTLGGGLEGKLPVWRPPPSNPSTLPRRSIANVGFHQKEDKRPSERPVSREID